MKIADRIRMLHRSRSKYTVDRDIVLTDRDQLIADAVDAALSNVYTEIERLKLAIPAAERPGTTTLDRTS